jgi:hypothetical protein
MPSTLPMLRNIQAKSTHLREASDPLLVEAPRDEGRHGEGEGHRAADEAHVEARRVDRHVEVLQQRVEPLAVGGRAPKNEAEGVRREGHQHQEEHHHAHQRGDHVGLRAPGSGPSSTGDAGAGVEPRAGRTTRAASRPGRPRAPRRGRAGASSGRCSGRRNGCGSRGSRRRRPAPAWTAPPGPRSRRRPASRPPAAEGAGSSRRPAPPRRCTRRSPGPRRARRSRIQARIRT